MADTAVQTHVGQVLFDIVAAVFDDSRPVPEIPAELIGPRVAEVTFRAGGKKVRTQWLDGSVAALLADATDDVLRTLPKRGDKALTTIEITIPTGWTKLTADDFSAARCNDVRGRYGVEVRNGQRISRMGAMEQIARNLRPERCVEFLTQQLSDAPFKVDTWKFTADEYLIDLRQQQWFPISRGQTVVAQSDITQKTVQEMAASMTAWLLDQVGPRGKMTYKFYPANGNPSRANNPMRQFLASACLASVENSTGGGELHNAVQRNIKHNINAHYRTEGEFGIVDDGGQIKLGAAAAAMLAILSLPDPTPWDEQFQRLRAFIESMQNEDGSFRTFHHPADRTDGQTTYPGQALLALARLYERRPDKALLARLQAGLAHYRTAFRTYHNPEFVGWHTQAAALLHRFTGDADVAAFIFEMNDWVVGLQDSGIDSCPMDVVGDFFSPRHPHLGAPSAATTGLILEGLVDAWKVARDTGDSARAARYRLAILLGLRSLRQLQFRTDTDMYYLRRRSQVQGALRTAAFDSTIRIDNVYHALQAVMKILPAFSAAEYRL